METATILHPSIIDRLSDITLIEIETQEPAIRIISKEGPLNSPPDRDHCLQYMVACGLLFGNLTAEHYEDDIAKDERIDYLRNLIRVKEKIEYTSEYYDPDKRAIANAVTIYFKDGTQTERIEVKYPLGHRRHRASAKEKMNLKLENNLASRFEHE